MVDVVGEIRIYSSYSGVFYVNQNFWKWHFLHKSKLLGPYFVMNMGESDACGSWQLAQVSSCPFLEGSGTPWVGCL